VIALSTRFDAKRRRYIWKIVKQGPTEIGYAYFRARRRRRNRPDDETMLSESDKLAISGLFDATDVELQTNRRLIEDYRQSGPHKIRSIQWFLSYFPHAYLGGTYTILRFADHLARVHGVENRFHCYDASPDLFAQMAPRVAEVFPVLGGSSFTPAELSIDRLPLCDAAIATLWSGAYPVMRMCQTRAKFYFVQDNEPQFYPAGAAAALAEQTYRFGLPGIVNTPGLADVYGSYGNPSVAFVPAVDLDCYHPPDVPRDPAAPVRVFFYGRPGTPRNAFGLGLLALDYLKSRCRDGVEIVCAGQDWSPGQFGVKGRIGNLGRLGSHEEVAALYRSCDIGLVFMGTKHPSYQPLEFMASGMATVSNINPATEWLLRDGENCLLSPPLPTPIADRLARLVDDVELRRRIQTNGLELVRSFHWGDQIDRVYRAMCREDDAFAVRPRSAADEPPVLPA
jgi:glycosyltransferase involved in cell wall biosynthesis